MMAKRVYWSYFDKFEKIDERYLPKIGEGETKATQVVTAVVKLIYKWYNDGDVFDNTYDGGGWCNDLSSYANWLYKNTDAGMILERKLEFGTSGSYWDPENGEYEQLLKELADKLLDEDRLEKLDQEEKVGSIYKCEGPFRFEIPDDDEEDYYFEEQEDEDDDE